jgi:hypothetical protein
LCPYSFTLVPVETEAKLVDVKWEKSCSDNTICVNPHHNPGGYAAPIHCVEDCRQQDYRKTCVGKTFSRTSFHRPGYNVLLPR